MRTQIQRFSLLLLLASLFGLVSAASALAFDSKSPLELTLDSTIAMALKNSPSVRGAELTHDSAIAKVEEVSASVLPKAGLTGTYTRLSDGIPLLTVVGPPDWVTYREGPKDNYSFGLSVTQPLYTGGALPAALRAAKASRTSAGLDLEAARQATAWQVAQGYYGLLTAEHMVTVAEQAVQAAEAHLTVVKASYEAGTTLKTDVLRTEISLSQARQNLIKSTHAQELARLSLCTLLGLPGETQFRLAEPPQKARPATTYEENLALALRQRPDLASARQQLELGRAGVAQAKSGLLPTVALVASDEYSGTELDDLDGSWMVTVNATYNLLDWGAAKAKVRQAKDGLSGLELRIKGLEDQIRIEVSQADQALTEAQERLPMAEATLQQAKENLELTQLRYDSGLATTVDLLDSQALLAQGEANRIQAVYDFNLALARMVKATGEVMAKN